MKFDEVLPPFHTGTTVANTAGTAYHSGAPVFTPGFYRDI